MRIAVGVEQLERMLDSLIGKPLWAATVTRDDQSSLLLDFGRKILVTDNCEKPAEYEDEADEVGQPVRLFAGGDNSAASGDEQYRGELSLLVWCNWRVEMGEAHIVCGSQDSADEGGPIQGGLGGVLGDTVTDISLNSFLDLLTVFSSGKRLRLFCDQSGHENNDDSYRLFTAAGQMYGVATGLIEVGQV